MTSSTGASARSDLDLLAVARNLLRAEGFAIEDVVDNVDVILAENAYFFVGVSATATIAQLLDAEGIVSRIVSERLAAEDVGPKLWDGYVVLLTQEHATEDARTTQSLFEINYDTSGVRRLAQTGVAPTPDSVSAALSPFLRPLEANDPAVTDDPFDLLVQSLSARGVEPDLGSRLVRAFTQGVDLDNVV